MVVPLFRLGIILHVGWKNEARFVPDSVPACGLPFRLGFLWRSFTDPCVIAPNGITSCDFSTKLYPSNWILVGSSTFNCRPCRNVIGEGSRYHIPMSKEARPFGLSEPNS